MVTLRQGGIDISGGVIAGSTARIEALVEGFDLGSGEPLTTALPKLLRDGADVVGDSSGNRLLKYVAEIKADNWDDLADAEALLVGVIDRVERSAFEFVPDAVGAPTGVIDTFRGRLSARFDAGWNAKLQCFLASYDVEVPALPRVRSKTKRVTTFSPGFVGTPAVFEDCTSKTKFTAPGATLSTVSWLGDAAVLFDLPNAGYGVPTAINVDWTGTVPAANFLALEVAPAAGTYLGYDPSRGSTYASPSAGVSLNGVQPLAYEYLSTGYIRFWFVNPGAGASTLHWRFFGTAYNTNGLDFYVGGIYSASAVGTSGLLGANIGGSVRMPGSITVARVGQPGFPLDHVFIYADPAMLTYGYNPDVAASWALAPGGDGQRYAVWLRTNTLGLAAGDAIESTITLAGKVQKIRTKVEPMPSGPIPAWLPVGEAPLAAGRDGRVGSTLSISTSVNGVPIAGGGGTPAGGRHRIFRDVAGITSLTYCRVRAADNKFTIILDAPSIERPQGGIWIDDAPADDLCEIWDYPTASPPVTPLFVIDEVITNNTNAPLAVTFEAYDGWHTLPGGNS